jgi:hypothetical protein
MPIAILVNENTSGPAEWVAAALQDADPPGKNRRRSVLVGYGNLTAGDSYVRTAHELPGGDQSLVLATGVWERPNTARPEAQGDTSQWRLLPDVDSRNMAVRLRELPMSIDLVDPESAKISVAKPNDKFTVAISGPAAEVPRAAQIAAAPIIPDQEVDRRYKNAAVAAILGQLKLAAKS